MGLPFKVVELKGHIIDSLTFPKVLDEILDRGGNYETEEIRIGKTKKDQSYARIRVYAPTGRGLKEIVDRLYQLGAMPLKEKEVILKEAEKDGVFPRGFYVTQGLATEIFLAGRWLPVEDICPDCGIRVDETKGQAQAVKFYQVTKGDKLVVGSQGVRVLPLIRFRPRGLGEFPTRFVSADRSKEVIIEEIAQKMKLIKAQGGRTLMVLGDAVIKAGCLEYLCQLIQKRYVHAIFGGNGLAADDLAAGLARSARPTSIEKSQGSLWAINYIIGLGGIKEAFRQGKIKQGLLYACLRRGADFLLLGTPQDDGPLPEVVTDTLAAQRIMREKIREVSLVIMVASMFHSLSVAKLLPAWVPAVVVDVNPAVVSRVTERAGFQTLGMVTDAELFLRELWRHLSQR